MVNEVAAGPTLREPNVSKEMPTTTLTLVGQDSAIVGPKDSECLRIARAFKKALDTTGVVWKERTMMLTKDRIVYSEVGDPERTVLDYIELFDMVECEVIKHGDSEGDDALQELIFRTTEDGRNW